jgi:hypothetical protein
MMTVRQERVVTPEQSERHQELSAQLAELSVLMREAWSAGSGSSPESQEHQQQMRELESELADLSRQIRQRVPARLRELAAALDPNWLAVVSDPGIEGCGKCGTGIWRPRFEFICDQSWADMEPTGVDNVRRCETCRKNVYFCDNLADAREHSQQGHCIAVDLGIIRRDGDLIPPTSFVGRPSQETIRRTYEENLDPVSQTRLDARKQSGKPRKRMR